MHGPVFNMWVRELRLDLGVNPAVEVKGLTLNRRINRSSSSFSFLFRAMTVQGLQ